MSSLILKRNFAIIVYLNKNIVKLILNFANTIFYHNLNSGKENPHAIEDCKRFISLYNNYSQNSEKNCENNLFGTYITKSNILDKN